MTEDQGVFQNAADAPDVHRLRRGGREVIIVGTAHVSRASAETVTRIIEAEKPDTVCIELCDSRYQAMMNPEAFRNMNIVEVIRKKRVYLLLSHLLLASFQKRIADKLGIQAGQEMIAAVGAAKSSGAEILPVDRDIRTTLSRAWRLMGFWGKMKLLFQMVGAFAEAEDISEEEVEALKEKDALEMVIQELGEMQPGLRKVLIDERDLYLTEKIRSAPGEKVVAVVGAGHVPGIKRSWEKDIDVTALMAMPKKSPLVPVLKWGLPLAIIAFIIGGFFFSGAKAGMNMVVWWIGVNAVLAGLGAIIALGHPLTVLSAAVAAPITSLNPTIAAGWVSGLVEAWLRKPQVRDMETISEDILSARGFWTNKITRVLLVVIFTNLGSMIGTFVALPLMARYWGT
ncbi:MAG: TraB/GumN family protein [Thermodesulfobacteriota bacterium]